MEYLSQDHRHPIDKLALINAIITGFALYPQIFKLIANTAGAESASGLSPITFFLIFLNSIVWLTYGVHRGLLSLIITSILNMIASAIILLIILIV